MTVDDLPTPCILIERTRLEKNMQRMQRKADENGVVLRPHVKTHKSLSLGRRQLELGATGVVVAKVGEAEIFAGSGFDDIRVAYALIGEEKYGRLLDLIESASISFCVDTIESAERASAYFESVGSTAHVLLEVNSGHNRCGVDPEDSAAVMLARRMADLPGLDLVGILTHAGHSYAGPTDGESPEDVLRRVSRHERDVMLRFAARLQSEGVPGVEPGAFEISIGSTPSMRYFENREHQGFRITEIRPGNYVFNDAIQCSLEVASLEECALTVLASVVSRHRGRSGRERLFVDAGSKVLTSDTGSRTNGYGILLYNARTMQPLPHARIGSLSEEHGWVDVSGGSILTVGDRVRIVPNHACVVVNTQDLMYVVEEERVVDSWPIDARGRVI